MMGDDLAEFDSAYRERLKSGQLRWQPGVYDDFEMRPFLDAMVATTSIRLEACRALDLGCGTGQTALFLAQHGAQVTGVDCSPSAIHLARRLSAERGLEVEFIVGDIRSMDFAHDAFDLILDCRFLHCVVNWDDRAVVLRKLDGALRRNGELWSETMIGVPVICSGPGFHLDEEGIFWKALPPEAVYSRALERDGARLSPIRRIHRSVAAFNAELNAAGLMILHQEMEAPTDDFSVWMVRSRARSAVGPSATPLA